MKHVTSSLILVATLGFGLITSGATPLAAAPSEDRAQQRFRSRIGDRQVRAILTRIRSGADALVQIMDGVPPRGRIYGNRARTADDPVYLVEDLLTATNHLDDHITRAIETRADVDDLLRRAALVDQAFGRTTQTRAATNAWTNLRREVESVASAYNLTWDWRNPTYSNDPATGLYQQLQGTYTLDIGRSDNVQRIMNTTLRGVAVADRDRVQRQMNNRLDPPEIISIDRNSNRIIVASSHGPQFTFDADSRSRTETGGAGQTITTRASLYGDQLTVTTTGVQNNEFSVTFEPLRNGQDLRVTRQIYNDALSRPVTVQTTYRRTSTTPDWTVSNRPATPRPGRGNAGVIVPDGTVLTGRLEQTVNLRQARDEDRLTLTVVNAPRADLEGATLEGYVVSNLSSLDERARIALQFDSIRLRDGRTAQFDGVIEQITAPNGQVIRFDGETARIDSRSGDAVQRGALGAVVGGIIGALAGGTKGALIGAAIGGGGAAATVLVDSPGQPELQRGTEFRLRAQRR